MRVKKFINIFIFLAVVFSLAGCTAIGERVVLTLFYRQVTLPQDQILKDLEYWSGRFEDRPKHRLDFYVPSGHHWPVLIFVHGGSWRSGDKALRFGDTDPYGNIGRFYAARGIGVAVINYRLQPAVTWRDQLQDVARAMKWVYEHSEANGASRNSVFLFGHSAGAHLAARTALDHELLEAAGLPPGVPCGVIAVSGAPYDIADAKTYELGTDPARFERPFRADDTDGRWIYDASPLYSVTPSAPPFLLLHGGWESRGIKRQNQIMFEALRNAGVKSRLVETTWDGHFLIVASLSRHGSEASAEVLRFIRATKCP